MRYLEGICHGMRELYCACMIPMISSYENKPGIRAWREEKNKKSGEGGRET